MLSLSISMLIAAVVGTLLTWLPGFRSNIITRLNLAAVVWALVEGFGRLVLEETP